MSGVIIIVISSPESRRHILLKEHLDELGLEATVSSAVFVEGAPDDVAAYDHDRRIGELGYGLTKGEVGCFLAHRLAWKKVAAGDRPALVLEDDARLEPRRVPELRELADAITGTTVILRLFSQRHPRAKLWRHLPSGADIVRPLSSGYSAVAYMLDPAGAKALLLSSTRFWQTVDDHMDDEPAHECVIMHVLPELVRHEDEGLSLIGERRKPHLSMLARIRREWRRALRKIRLAWHREKTLWSLGLRWSRCR